MANKPSLTQHSSGPYLLPCPLCGENPREESSLRRHDFGKAIECQCGLMLVEENDGVVGLIKLWNQRPGTIRTPDDPPMDLLEPIWLICPTRILSGYWNEGWVLDEPLQPGEEPMGWIFRGENNG